MSLITITTGIGCEGMAIGQLVADGLELELYDDQRLQEEASKIEFHLKPWKTWTRRLQDSSTAFGAINLKYSSICWKQ